MKRYYVLNKEMLGRVTQYFENNPIAPPMERATELIAETNTLQAAVDAHGGSQVLGLGGYRGGATERRVLAKELRTVLVDMAATARGLEPQYPGITDQFRLGTQSNSHQKLLDTAAAFVTAVGQEGVKALFTGRSFAADFDVQLTAKIEALAMAVGRKATGRQTQRGGTAGLDLLIRQTSAVMRELRPLMVKYLRENNPTLLAVWKDAARVYRMPTAAAVPAEPPPSEGGDGGGGTESGSGS